MPHFKYVAKDPAGKTMTGTLEVTDRNTAIEMLRKKDLIIVTISEAKKGSNIFTLSFGKKKVKLDDIVVFSRQLATMVDAGIPLVGALDILSDQLDNKTFGDVLRKVRNDVETGSSLSDALGRHKNIFSALFVNMVKAGESSGMLDDILDRLAAYLEKTSNLQKKVKAALIYPMIVSSMAIIITLVLLLKVIPVFKNIFASFGAKLPAPTLILLGISDFLQQYFLLFVGIMIGLGFFFRNFLKTKKGRFIYDTFLLNMPVFGILIKKVAISKFTRTLSTLIKSGVPILTSLEIVGKTAGNTAVEAAVENISKSVRDGENIAEPLARAKIFPSMVTRMVMVGEQAGELEKMLTKIADFYDEQVDTAVSGLTSMIEPLIIAFLGIVIGSIVICMFLPIFKVANLMSS